MLIYSVVVAKDTNHETDEFVLETYSNEKSAQEHEKFVEENNCVFDDYKWDYVFIRETRVAEIFEKEYDDRISLDEYLNVLEHDRMNNERN